MTIAVYVDADFKARYPEFASVNGSYLSACFDESGDYLSNTDSSIVQNVDKRTRLLWMLTAHIATLGGKGSGVVLPVGRVSSAAKGSVSTSLDYIAPTVGSGPWFQQTQYGASFWAATVKYRSFRYLPNPTRF